MNKYKHQLLLFTILLLGILFRVFQIKNIPSELNRDELAIGYNAFSLLKTNKDEHGEGPWPIAFRSFGDYKLPGQIYTTAIFINFLGLDELAVRLPTVIFASATLLIFYFLVLEITENKKTALLACMLLSFSFWHIHASRSAYEPVAGLFFTSSFTLFLLKGIKNKFFWILALLAFFLGSFFYNLPLLLSPLIFISFAIIFRNNLLKNKLLSFILIFLFFTIFLISFNITASVSSGKSGATLFNNENFQKKIELLQYQFTLSGINHRLSNKIAHKNLLTLWHVSRGYFSTFNPEYMFFKGDGNHWHSMREIDIGNFNPMILPLFIFGVIYLLKNIKNSKYQFLLSYLLISPIPSATTIDAPITNRLLDFHLAVLLISSIALSAVFINKKIANFFKILIMTTYSLFFINFLIYYFVFYKDHLHPSWYPQSKELVKEVSMIKKDYQKIIVANKDLYIHFLFYLAFDPEKLQSEAVWKKDGFEYVESFDNFIFTTNIDEVINKKNREDKILVIRAIDQNNFNNDEKNKQFVRNRFGGKKWQLEKVN